MSIKNYAIIDHIGSLTSGENKRIYKKVYAQAKADELTAYTVKKICIQESPYCKEITSAMKYRIRYTKNPVKVYLVCDSLDVNAEYILNIWESRGIAVEVFEANGFLDTHTIDIDGKASINRRLAEIWAPAFDYQFSAPITRVQRETNIENFSKRPDYELMVESGETHFTKPFTNAETFLEMNRCIAPDSEIKEFRKYFDAYLTCTGCEIDTKVGASFGSIKGNTSELTKFFACDYIICEECGRPHKSRTGETECPHCSKATVKTYFTDDTCFVDEDTLIDDYEELE